MEESYALQAEREMHEAIATQERSSTERAGYRRLEAKYAGTCDACSEPVAKGQPILYNRRHELRLLCLDCGARADAGENLEPRPPGNGHPRLTHRERLERKAERRAEWAQSRAQKAADGYAAGRAALDVIPFGQPVHGVRDRNYRDKATAKLERSFEHSQMAEHHASAGAGIEAQLRASIYDDDPDAIEQLGRKLGELEGQRDRIKAYNAACSKAKRCTAEALELLDERQRADIESTARSVPAFMGASGQFPAYHLQNLSGNITRTRQRLERLRRQES